MYLLRYINTSCSYIPITNSAICLQFFRRQKRRKTTEMRKQEIEDSPSVLAKKCERMAKAIQKAKYLIVYTGAGISTAANIPDYR